MSRTPGLPGAPGHDELLECLDGRIANRWTPDTRLRKQVEDYPLTN